MDLTRHIHTQSDSRPTQAGMSDYALLQPELLSALLKDHTTQRNIFWATDDYSARGKGYGYRDEISVEAITGENAGVVVARSRKSRQQQQQRSREMAEVFTPAWICNKQNNLIDNAWFGREGVFNTEIDRSDGTHSWEPTNAKIDFPEGKSWRDYVTDTRMEITCGEAPYLVSRYDAVSGITVPPEGRVGLLDRKLRVVSENTGSSGEWLAAAKAALRSVYGFEWQGDNLILARLNLLYTILEHYQAKFGRQFPKQSMAGLAYIISWNIVQMDGLKGVIPDSCGERRTIVADLFGETETVSQCEGCRAGNIREHNGTYALIADWPKDVSTSQVRPRKTIRFIDLMK